MTEPVAAHYRGQDKRGVARTGSATDESPTVLTERLYDAGWRSLTVTIGGAEVGRIEHGESGRTWWAEADPEPVADDRARVIAAHFPNVVVEPNGAVRARCESSRCEWYVLRDTPRTYRNWRVVIRLHSAHLAAVLTALSDTAAPVPVDATLTEDERRDLGCACVRLDNEWHHVPFCRVPVVEHILAQRAAPDPRIEKVRAVADEFAACKAAALSDRELRTVAKYAVPEVLNQHLVTYVLAKVADDLRAALDGDST